MAEATVLVHENKREVWLDAVSSTTNSGAKHPRQIYKTFDIQITNTATVVLEVLDNSGNWQTISTSTADALVTANDAYHVMRARVSAYTSGTVTVVMYA